MEVEIPHCPDVVFRRCGDSAETTGDELVESGPGPAVPVENARVAADAVGAAGYPDVIIRQGRYFPLREPGGRQAIPECAIPAQYRGTAFGRVGPRHEGSVVPARRPDVGRGKRG